MKRREFFASCVTFVVAPQVLLGCTRTNTLTAYEELCHPFPAYPAAAISPDLLNRMVESTRVFLERTDPAWKEFMRMGK